MDNYFKDHREIQERIEAENFNKVFLKLFSVREGPTQNENYCGR
ncbi:hypothetical protein [Coxiella burnetii]|uniref:Uncharacterized protein n=2 Tax=Coxiella burnetii TaxID=777 RepID=Q83B52_COXBU|nr:hypothetical protein [Coxiella burnetii]NP_820645.1 hypothetical protein CBU_1663 [Coxiella burnetii RSA 493]AAO91159.1 hypothetical protein CBU_1663 [Coxiella burnetii RSA 493]ABX78945.1 hypothetical protein COXBURSA331_A1855 [Coxiella burnetii RSA 331]ACI23088.1 hypothetical protein CBUD_0333a [Coxiella burnetii Dugway 5J108-111]ACJ17786.1 hypothetical protein CbuG_0352 [Coxiella burnetii CbuG_Q212]ACJ19645.1 hypothetical protein CbuK_0345 [Coxiella burnetii CbuK_Q154]